MAGFSLILIMLVFLWPVMLVGTIVTFVAIAAAEFVTSPAFPLLIISGVLGTLAAVDLIRILWRKYREREAFKLEGRLFVRPAILCVLSFAVFVAMCVLTGSMILDWYHSLE